jgi:hypothetical protein
VPVSELGHPPCDSDVRSGLLPPTSIKEKKPTEHDNVLNARASCSMVIHFQIRDLPPAAAAAALFLLPGSTPMLFLSYSKFLPSLYFHFRSKTLHCHHHHLPAPRKHAHLRAVHHHHSSQCNHPGRPARRLSGGQSTQPHRRHHFLLCGVCGCGSPGVLCVCVCTHGQSRVSQCPPRLNQICINCVFGSQPTRPRHCLHL